MNFTHARANDGSDDDCLGKPKSLVIFGMTRRNGLPRSPLFPVYMGTDLGSSVEMKTLLSLPLVGLGDMT